MDTPSTEPLMTSRRWSAVCRVAGSWATLLKPDNTSALNLKGVFDNVDTRQQLDTGIASGTPIFEVLTSEITDPATGLLLYGNGDLLHIANLTYRLHGKPLTDHVAGLTTLTLARTPV